MKNYHALLLTGALALVAASCNTGSAVHDGRDTAKNEYDVTTNIDTSATTSQMSNSTSIDNTASGGALIHKDTTHMKVRTVQIQPAAAAPVTTPAKADSAQAKPKQ